MIPATTFKGKRTALFGLGGSGLATGRALREGGARVIAWDDSPERVGSAAEAGMETADLRGIDWHGVDSFVLSPGIPLTHPKPHWSVELAQAAGVEIIGDIEIFCRERRAQAPDCPFIAITGTNGKSTTTALIAHILKAAGRDTQMGGNIGTAVLSLEPPEASRHFVVECSSYQIDLSPSLDPSAGLLLNLSPDHLDRHGTMQRYALIKERLVTAAGLAIIGMDDSYATAIAERTTGAGVAVKRISANKVLADGFYGEGHHLMESSGGAARPFADLSDIPTLRGAHNAQNAAAAVAACRAVGLSDAAIVEGMRSFPGLQHRMQPVARQGKTLFVNDSKATNAEAAAPALSSYEHIHWIAGGLPKEGGIASLVPLFGRIDKAYFIGEAAALFAATMGAVAPYEISGTLDKAVASAAADAAASNAPAPVVMLSPACASFDQYRNFELRGDAFVAAVAKLPDVTMLVPSDTGSEQP